MRENRRALLGTVMALLALMPVAWCADVVVCQGTSCEGYESAETVATIDEALAQFRATGSNVTRLYLTPGTYSCNLEFTEADGALEIIGLGEASGNTAPAETVVLDAANGAAPVVWFQNVSRSVTLENLTITGGAVGVRTTGTVSNVVLDRCYIVRNATHGVFCEGSVPAGLALVNCSIHANGLDGVRIETQGAASADEGVNILQCTILDNVGSGVYVKQHGAALVRNTLVYRNGGITEWGRREEFLVGAYQDDPARLNPMTDSEWQSGPPLGKGGLTNPHPDPTAAKTSDADPPVIYGVDLANDGDYSTTVPAEVFNTMSPAGPVPTNTPGGAVSTIVVPPYSPGHKWHREQLYVGALGVRLDITHPCPRALTVALVAPDGTRAVLLSNVGGCSDSATYGMQDVLIRDDASLSSIDVASLINVTVTPVDTLRVFDALPAAGEWRLEITDAGSAPKYELVTDPATDIDAVLDTRTGSQWQVGVPLGGGGQYHGSPDPAETSTGEAGNVLGVKLGPGQPGGDYTPNIDGVYSLSNPCEIVTATGEAAVIRGMDVAESSIVIPNTNEEARTVIGDLNVILNVTYPCLQSLSAVLRHDLTGATVRLFDAGNGAEGSGLHNTLFDDDTASLLAAGTAPYQAVFRPAEPLALFDGESLAGTWTLELNNALGTCERTILLADEVNPGVAFGEWPGSEWAYGAPQGLGGPDGNPDPPDQTERGAVLGVNLAGNYQPNLDGHAAYPPPLAHTAQKKVYWSTEIPGAVVSPDTRRSTLVVPEDIVVGDVNVVVDIAYPHTEDLTLTLVHEGRSVQLTSGVPGNGGVGFSNTVFDDEATQPIDAAVAGATNFSDAYRPIQVNVPLAVFDGMPANSPWDLRVTTLGATTLLDEQFVSAAPQDPWTGYPSAWTVESGYYQNVEPLSAPFVSICNKAGSELWRDYRVRAFIRIDDWSTAPPGDNEVGIAFRCQSEQNCYRIGLFDKSPFQVMLGLRKVVGGVAETIGTPVPILTTGNVPVFLPLDFTITDGEVTVSPITVTVDLGPLPVISLGTLPADLTFPTGSVGVYARNVTGYFDYVMVDRLDPGESALNAWGLQIEPVHFATMENPVNLADVTVADPLTLEFDRWLNTDAMALIQYSRDGGASWQRLWWNQSPLDTRVWDPVLDSVWTPVEIDLSSVAAGAEAFLVRWGYHAGEVPYSGWNIDAARVLAPGKGTLNAWKLQVEPVYYATTPALNFANADQVELQFARWLNTDSMATIECSTDGVVWNRLWWNRNNADPLVWDAVPPENAWTDVTIPLTPYAAGQALFYVRWGYHPGVEPYSGWNIHNVRFLVSTVGELIDWDLQIEPVYYLTTDAMDFSDSASATSVDVSFWRWLNTGADSLATVDCSSDGGGTWNRLWTNAAQAVLDASWMLQTLDVSSFAKGVSDFRVRWGYHPGTIPYSGWNLDDVTVAAAAMAEGGGLVAEDADAGAPHQASYTCSFGHTNNRINFADGNARDMDPLVLPSVEWGKLKILSPMQNAGNASYELTPYTGWDFESQARSGEPDIGADEIAGGATLSWYSCVVDPPIIGAVPANTIQVVLGLQGLANQVTNVFICPQGENPKDPNLGFVATPDRFIRLTKTAGYGQIWEGTNADPIQTVLSPAGKEVPDAGDAVADGHGFVCVLTTEGFIEPSGSAVAGRHVLIDTIFPVMQFETAPPWTASQFLVTSNDGWTPSMAIGDVGHPGFPAIGTELRNGLAVPYDDGQIVLATGGAAAGSRLFFNPGSISNNHGPLPLDIVVRAQFVDPPVVDAGGSELLGADFSAASPGAPVRRVPAGFDAPAVDNGAPEDVLLNPGKPARWVPVASADPVAGVGLWAQATYAVSGTAPNNDGLTVQWRFFDRDPADPSAVAGLPYGLVAGNGNQYHVATQFAAMDRAGNSLEGPLYDPVHFWWLTDTGVRLSPDFRGDSVTLNMLSFTWVQEPAAHPGAVGQPNPLFSYRLWASADAGKDANGYDGPYEDITGWSGWTTDTSTPVNYFRTVGSALVGRYVIFAAIGADEAGNVMPWPAELAYNSGKITGAVGDGGPSWQRFFVEGFTASEVLDTILTPALWHEAVKDGVDGVYKAGVDGRFLGDAALVPLPLVNSGQALVFRVGLRYTPPANLPNLPASQVCFRWTFYAPDLLACADRPVEFPDSGCVCLPLPDGEPGSVWLPFPENLRLSRQVECTFTAYACHDDYDADHCENPGPLTDPTPATFSFVLTPSVSGYIAPKDSADHQPVLIHSNEDE